MLDLAKFSDTCSYCYKGLQEGITICGCNCSLCEDHSELHMSKFGCDTLCTLSLRDGGVKILGLEDAADLERKIDIKVKNGMIKSGDTPECAHVYDSANVPVDLQHKGVTCSKCDLDENLWVCMECGHVGCGRKQEGMKGEGHALAHFEETKHPNTVLLSSIKDERGETFCYLCENFVQNPLRLKISVKNEEIKSFTDLSTSEHQKPVKSNLLGIVNEGQNCYVSSVLHLLSKALEGVDLSDHFMICESNPVACLACQLVKVLNEMRNAKDEIRSVRITGLLTCVFEQDKQFIVNRQEDCSEFFQKLLEKLECFEECMLLPKVTNIFEYQTKADVTCETCGKMSSSSVGKILYLPFKASIRESLHTCTEPHKSECKCGKEAPIKPTLTKLGKYLVLSVGRYRYFEQKYIKIEDPIEAEDVKLVLADGQYVHGELLGCICHKGKEIVSGHYTWWMQEDGKFYAANDSTVTKSDAECSKQGSVFLYKLTRNK